MAGKDLDPDITGLIKLWQEGKEDALEDLFPRIYHPLRIVARRAMQTERTDHTLQPTALVHEAFLKLTESTTLELHDRQHFFALAATMMRRILVDHARKGLATRRGGAFYKVTLADQGQTSQSTDLLALNEALDFLGEMDPRKAKIIELRFFGGLSVKEIAELLSVSEPTVILDTRLAKAFLFKHIQEGSRAL